MLIRIRNGIDISYYRLVDGARWDRLNEGRREFIRHNGKFKIAELVKTERAEAREYHLSNNF